MEVYGSLFRPAYKQLPLWLRILLGVLVAAMVVFAAGMFFQASQMIWTYYRLLPPGGQDLTLRLVVTTLCTFFLAGQVQIARYQLFLDPCIRDLAMTPARPLGILRIVHGLRWQSLEAWRVTIWTIFSTPWFQVEWSLFAVDPSGAWWFLLPFSWPLGVLSALCFAVLWVCLSRALSVAINLLQAALGFGGLGARYPLLATLFRNLWKALALVLLAAACSALLVLYGPRPEPELAPPGWHEFGSLVLGLLRDAEHPVSRGVALFPPVMFFDALRTAVNGPYFEFRAAMSGVGGWLAVALVLSALLLKRGYGARVRLGLDVTMAAARPADAAEDPARRFDPDEVSGPLEGLLIRYFGRMGRAALRLVTSHYEAGAVDAHLRRSLWAVPVCLVGAWLSARIVPQAADAVLRIFGWPLSLSDQQNIATVVVATWVSGTLLYRIKVWGTLVTSDAQLAPLDRGAATGPLRSFRIYAYSRGRGDPRYPPTETYAIGLSDAVLLPTFYLALWSLPMVLLGFLEGAVLGLPLTVLGWTAAILVPALLQIYFFLMLLTAAGNWMDYRRSYLLHIAYGLAGTLTLLAAVGLVTALCWNVIEGTIKDRPWIGWLGSVNILMVFNIAFYASVRLLYLRRRFDAERSITTR